MFIQIRRSNERAHERDRDSQQDPEHLRADLPRQAVVRTTGAKPADADDRVPAELAPDHCSYLAAHSSAVAHGVKRGGVLTGRQRYCEVEQEGPEDVVFLQREPVERVHEDQLQVQRDAEDEPVGDACGGSGLVAYIYLRMDRGGVVIVTKPELDHPGAGNCIFCKLSCPIPSCPKP